MIREVVRVCGADRAQIDSRLSALDGCGVNFKVDYSCYDAAIEMSGELSAVAFGEVRNRVYAAFEKEVYCASDIPLETLAAKLLKLNGRTLAVAESLTGGEICSRLTSVPGISENFYEGVVCYNRRSKMRRLGVSRGTLADYGAVSKQTAKEMVGGLLNSPVDVAVATTGLAGPAGDEGKPVGLVYIAVGGGDFIAAFERRFEGDRNTIRHAAANVALFYLVKYLMGEIFKL